MKLKLFYFLILMKWRHLQVLGLVIPVSKNRKKRYKVTSLAAKSKVNPIKNKTTIPNLELCAAHLLAKILNKVQSILGANIDITAWSDFQIIIAWITYQRSKDKFVKTRVADITRLLTGVKLEYVKSEVNPADITARGISASKPKDIFGGRHQNGCNNLLQTGQNIKMRIRL